MTMARIYGFDPFFEDEWVNSAFGEMREILSSMKIRFPLSNVLVNKKSGDLIMKKIHKFMGRGIIDENYRKKD